MAKAKVTLTQEDEELLGLLGVDVEVETKSTHTPRQARIIAGFEEIEAFFEKNSRLPLHGEGRDIFERIYATRLEAIAASQECRDVLTGLDKHGLLDKVEVSIAQLSAHIDDDELLEQLGVDVPKEGDLTNLTHVKSTAEKKAAEEIGSRTLCPDFEKFKPLFVKVKDEIKDGTRKTLRFKEDASINQGEYFILNGQIAYIDQVGELTEDAFGKWDGRLRIIFDNGAESNILLRSLQKALYKDEAGRRVTNPNAGPLFDDYVEDSDHESGTIYVLRSKSEHPEIKANVNILHKIGVTGGDVDRRIANAKLDPTFLMADVEVIATYELYNINRTKLENLLHRFFEGARLDIEIIDRFGTPVTPREWFLVPLFVIDEVVEKIKDGTLAEYRYSPKEAKLLGNKAS
jgi:T5orf172 domain